jgi:rhamnogalacturonyl hydrolase YesR
LYKYTHDERFRKQGVDLADEQWKNPQPDGLTNQTRYWIDDMYMIGSLQVEAYRITGNTIYLERAAKELDAYLKKLQQPNGLFFHGPDAHFYWGRGNGWVAAGLAELLSVLPKENPYYTSIHDGFVKMMNALLNYQADDGMWRQLIDYPNAWKETSSTAMFGYAMKVGVKKRILSAKKFKPASEKAWLALTKYLNDQGELTDVCVGTGQSKDAQYYLDRGRSTGDFHGQAPMLWFAYSLLAGYK